MVAIEYQDALKSAMPHQEAVRALNRALVLYVKKESVGQNLDYWKATYKISIGQFLYTLLIEVVKDFLTHFYAVKDSIVQVNVVGVVELWRTVWFLITRL